MQVRPEWTCRVSREEASRFQGADAPTTFKDIDSLKVVGVNNSCAGQAAEELSRNVYWYLPPRKAAPHRKRQGDCGVNVATGNTAGDPNANCRAYTPANSDR
jgi:hypothetical protein